MADDSFVRSYRSNDVARRPSAPPRDAPSRDMPSRDIPSRDFGENDPLAELARLIGSGDPFADLDRPSAPAAERRHQADPPPADWRTTAAALARESMRNPPADPDYDEVDGAIAAAKSLRAAPADRFPQYDQEPTYDQDAPDDYADNPYDDAPRGRRVADDRHYVDHRADTQHDPDDSENYFFEGDAAPTDERFYDDPPRARTTNSLLTVAVLVGCGILGTAGAYGYRTYYSGTRSADAPIITTDSTPIKIVPADTGKPNQERVGDGNERMVARQEEPVTLSDPSGSINPTGAGGSRGVLPPPFTPSPGPGPSVQGSAPTPSGAGSEPKKVHTLAIRPDGTMDPAAKPIGGSPTLPSAPATATRQPPQPTKPAPTPAPPVPARAGAGPLSIDPQEQVAAADPAYQAPQRAPASPPPAPAPKLASASSAPAGGAYLAQVSSQRSEAEAQTAFRGLQSKYPRELGDREATVRRVDLGAKGIYFRSLVGPFGSADDANQFCRNLKAEGADCLVLKN
jgi:hypothetical protein